MIKMFYQVYSIALFQLQPFILFYGFWIFPNKNIWKYKLDTTQIGHRVKFNKGNVINYYLNKENLNINLPSHTKVFLIFRCFQEEIRQKFKRLLITVYNSTLMSLSEARLCGTWLYNFHFYYNFIIYESSTG